MHTCNPYFFAILQFVAAAGLLFGPIASRAAEFGPPEDREFVATFDGSTQKYVELLPADRNPEQPVDVLIALHGHGADRWQYVRETRGECKGVRNVAAAHAMIFISPDYRAKTSWMGPAAEADMLQLIGLLRERHKVRRIYLAGASMGGTSVLIFAALHDTQIAGVLSENGTANMLDYSNFLDAIAESYGGSKEQKPEEYKKRSPELTPGKFTMPLALCVGGNDTIVPPDSVRRLAKKLENKKDLLVLDNVVGGHSTTYEDTIRAIEFVIQAAEAKGEH